MGDYRFKGSVLSVIDTKMQPIWEFASKYRPVRPAERPVSCAINRDDSVNNHDRPQQRASCGLGDHLRRIEAAIRSAAAPRSPSAAAERSGAVSIYCTFLEGKRPSFAMGSRLSHRDCGRSFSRS